MANEDVSTSDVLLCELAVQARAGNVTMVMDRLREYFERRMTDGCESGNCRTTRHTSRLDRAAPLDPRDLSLVELGLPIRTVNALEYTGLAGRGDDAFVFPGALYAGDLVKWSAAELGELPHIGPRQVWLIRVALGKVGLALRGESPPSDFSAGLE